MSAQVLNILKYFLLALVWLFFLRVLRVAWVEIRTGGAAPEEAPAPAPRAGLIPARRRTAPAPATASTPTPAALPTHLRVVDPADRAGQQFSLSPRSGATETVIGRAAGADIPLGEDSFASSRHARVFERGGAIWIEDVGSTNGTLVNGNRVSSPVQLNPGDRVQVGRTTMEVEA